MWDLYTSIFWNYFLNPLNAELNPICYLLALFRPYRAIIRPYYKNRFSHFQYILGSQIVYIDGIVVTMLYAVIYSKVKVDINP
jgi:hypothetical protein